MSPDPDKTSLKYKNILAIFLIILATGVMLSSNIGKGPFSSSGGKVLGVKFPDVASFFAGQSTFSFMFKNQSAELEKIIQKDLSGKDGQYAVYIADLTDSERYSLNSSEMFPAASLYKLYLIAAVLKQIEIGQLKSDSLISASKSHLVEVYGETDFGYDDYEDDDKIEYTVDEALQRVGRVSDNFSAILLAEKIGWSKIQDMANELGATSTVIKAPIRTSADDISKFLKLLYQKQIVSPEVSDQITAYLKLNQLNDRIPAGVPDDVEVVHKTGELSLIRHDAGIVYLADTQETPEASPGSEKPAQGYIIVLMSKDLKHEDEAIDNMAQVSKDIYNYFNAKYSKS